MKYNNKIFTLIIAFVIMTIPIVNFAGSIFLDEKFFAFRAWEVMVSSDNLKPFKPNARFKKIIYGDLANMLKVKKFRQYRYQKFTTDPYGYRNPTYKKNTYFPVVATGDSDMAGSSLSDEHIFSVCLENQIKMPVYNYAPSNPLKLFGDSRFIHSPPEIIIWEQIERTITYSTYSSYARLSPNMRIVLRQSQKTTAQEKKLPRLTAYYSTQFFHEIKWQLSGVLPPSIGYINNNFGILFYNEGLDMLKLNPQQRGIDAVLDGIERVHNYCLKRGIKLIYLPLPDKENIYQDFLPDSLKRGYPRPEFLEQLHSGLDARNILNVRLFEEFRKQTEKGNFLYFPDDTHWNEKGVSIAVQMTSELIKSLKRNPDNIERGKN